MAALREAEANLECYSIMTHAMQDSVAHIRATKGQYLQVSDIESLCDDEVAAMAGSITISNMQYRQHAEIAAAAALGAELGVGPQSDSSEGDSVDQSESAGSSKESGSDEEFIASGEGADDATPMQEDELSPPATILSARTRGSNRTEQANTVRVLTMPPKSDGSSSNGDEMEDDASDEVTDLDVDPRAVLLRQRYCLQCCRTESEAGQTLGTEATLPFTGTTWSSTPLRATRCVIGTSTAPSRLGDTPVTR
jgi:hypothetical protein